MSNKYNLVIGIDEAGRGPLAGPVSIGIFGGENKIGKWLLKNIFDNKLRDSKKLSEKKREEIYKKFLKLKKENKINFKVSHISNKIIDKIGISKAILKGISNCLTSPGLRLDLPLSRGGKTFIRLDGLLKAPAKFKNQITIIKGDEKDVWIACASIVAKVSRDRLMCRLALKYPDYDLEIHKGYGTALHRKLIKSQGFSSLHRVSFCSRI